MGPTLQYDVIIFDQEDALIDQGMSLPSAIMRAADAYLIHLLGIDPSGGPLFTLDDIRSFANAQPPSSDSHIVASLLEYAAHLLDAELSEKDFDSLEPADLLAEVRASGKITESLGDLAERKNISELIRQRRSRGSKRFSHHQQQKNAWLVMAEGHLMMDNYVERVLAEAYLGQEMFQAEHSQECMFVKESGTIMLEEPFINPENIAIAHRRCVMGAITRRSQSQAQHVLRHTGLQDSIDVVVSSKTSLSDAFSADEELWLRNLGMAPTHDTHYPQRISDAIDRIRELTAMETIPRIAYIGNCAAEGRNLAALKERYRLTLIGCVFSHPHMHPDIQREKGADFVLTNPQYFMRILSERPRMRHRHQILS